MQRAPFLLPLTILAGCDGRLGAPYGLNCDHKIIWHELIVSAEQTDMLSGVYAEVIDGVGGYWQGYEVLAELFFETDRYEDQGPLEYRLFTAHGGTAWFFDVNDSGAETRAQLLDLRSLERLDVPLAAEISGEVGLWVGDDGAYLVESFYDEGLSVVHHDGVSWSKASHTLPGGDTPAPGSDIRLAAIGGELLVVLNTDNTDAYRSAYHLQGETWTRLDVEEPEMPVAGGNGALWLAGIDFETGHLLTIHQVGGCTFTTSDFSDAVTYVSGAEGEQETFFGPVSGTFLGTLTPSADGVSAWGFDETGQAVRVDIDPDCSAATTTLDWSVGTNQFGLGLGANHGAAARVSVATVADRADYPEMLLSDNCIDTPTAY